MRGKLQFYKLYAPTYGGEKHNGDLQGWHEHTAGEQSLSIYHSKKKQSRVTQANTDRSLSIITVVFVFD